MRSERAPWRQLPGGSAGGGGRRGRREWRRTAGRPAACSLQLTSDLPVALGRRGGRQQQQGRQGRGQTGGGAGHRVAAAPGLAVAGGLGLSERQRQGAGARGGATDGLQIKHTAVQGLWGAGARAGQQRQGAGAGTASTGSGGSSTPASAARTAGMGLVAPPWAAWGPAACGRDTQSARAGAWRRPAGRLGPRAPLTSRPPAAAAAGSARGVGPPPRPSVRPKRPIFNSQSQTSASASWWESKRRWHAGILAAAGSHA